jgi:hypothetical protein
VLVAGDDPGPFPAGQRQQVVVTGIGRADQWCLFWIGHDLGELAQHEHEPVGIGGSDSLPNLWIRKRPLELR